MTLLHPGDVVPISHRDPGRRGQRSSFRSDSLAISP